jgi:hypothetical protein
MIFGTSFFHETARSEPGAIGGQNALSVAVRSRAGTNGLELNGLEPSDESATRADEFSTGESAHIGGYPEALGGKPPSNIKSTPMHEAGTVLLCCLLCVWKRRKLEAVVIRLPIEAEDYCASNQVPKVL